jgi:hypothetical protein
MKDIKMSTVDIKNKVAQQVSGDPNDELERFFGLVVSDLRRPDDERDRFWEGHVNWRVNVLHDMAIGTVKEMIGNLFLVYVRIQDAQGHAQHPLNPHEQLLIQELGAEWLEQQGREFERQSILTLAQNVTQHIRDRTHGDMENFFRLVAFYMNKDKRFDKEKFESDSEISAYVTSRITSCSACDCHTVNDIIRRYTAVGGRIKKDANQSESWLFREKLLFLKVGAEWLPQQGRYFVRDNASRESITNSAMTEDDTKLPAADEPPQKKYKKGN